MKISFAYPPNFDEIKKTFKLSGQEVFTFGDVIYNPNRFMIPDHLMTHESVHGEQQCHNDSVATDWWKRYFTDSKFRIDQEVEAYVAQYRFICNKVKDRNARFRNLHVLAQDLSGEMYGNILSYTDAIRLIRDGSDKYHEK